MQPVNIIALVLILGLELVIMSIEQKSNSLKFIGQTLVVVGWIMNLIAIIHS